MDNKTKDTKHQKLTPKGAAKRKEKKAQEAYARSRKKELMLKRKRQCEEIHLISEPSKRKSQPINGRVKRGPCKKKTKQAIICAVKSPRKELPFENKNSVLLEWWGNSEKSQKLGGVALKNP